MSALEAELSFNVGVVYIQELFLEKKNLSHMGFNLYWAARPHNRKDNHVLVVVWKDLPNKTIVAIWTNLVNYPYGMVLDITEREIHTKE